MTMLDQGTPPAPTDTAAIASSLSTDTRSNLIADMRRRRLGLLRMMLHPGALGLLTIVLLAILAPWIAPFGEAEINPVNALMPPSWTNLMGTDLYGRDVFSRVLYGGRLSLTIGCVAAVIAITIGTIVGVAAGYFGGATDLVAMRFIDILLAFPGTLLAIVIVAILGPNVFNLILAVGIGSAPGYARLVRAQTQSIRTAEFVTAAQVLGVRQWTIIARHILPNLRNSLIVYATLDIASIIMIAAGLGFLGLGARPPTAEWGVMVADGRETLRIAWWVTAFPGAAILLTTLSIYAFGERLAQYLDPKSIR